MNKDILIIFLKYPAKGRNKTRIAATLGDDFTLGLYSCFIKDILVMVDNITADKLLALDLPDGLDTASPDFETGYQVIRQSGDQLGEKIFNALSYAFESGYERAVLIGSDSPDLSSETVENAFRSLKQSEAVIGPAADGGYYLIGFTKESCTAEIFSGINWSTASVFSQTVKKLKVENVTPALLPVLHDIDDEQDLRDFYKRNVDSDTGFSHTMTYILESINSDKIFKIK